MEKLRVFEGFAGIGAVSKAIERLGIAHELVGFSEIDKYAIKSFSAVHDISEDLNHGDVCLIDETKLPDFDLYTFGSPCQDFSVAGKQKGATWTCKDCNHEYNPLDVHYSKRDFCPNCSSKEINKTRSSLVVEALRIIRHKKPKYLLMENVKNLIGKQFKLSFDKIIAELQKYGYNTYWEVLNAKNYGIPQNRERVFVISIRKDIDKGQFEFPKGFDSGIRLKDILEEEIEDKYYLSQEIQNRFKFSEKQTNNIVGDTVALTGKVHQKDGVYSTDGVVGTILSTDYKQLKQIIEVGQVSNQGSQAGKVYDPEGVFPTVCACTHGYAIGNIVETNKLNQVGCLGDKNSQGNRVYDINNISTTLVGNAGGLGGKTGLYLENINENKDLSPSPELVDGIGEINYGKQYRQGNRVYSSEKIAMCLLSQPVGNAGGYSYLYTVPQEDINNDIFKIKKATKKGYAEAEIGDSINIQFPNSQTRRGRVQKGVAGTLETACNQGTLTNDFRIRKLTPLECWRLMGFDDECFDRAKELGISDSGLYKQSGNSIVVNCLYYIFKELFKDYIKEN